MTGGRHQQPRPRLLDRARTRLERAWTRLGRAHAESAPRWGIWT